MDRGMRFFKQRAIVRGDAANHVWVDADAVVGKNGERGDVFEKSHVRGAERERKVRRQRRGDTKAARFVNDRADANFFGQFHRGDVA